MLAQTTYSDGAWNEAHFKSTEVDVDRLLTEARQTSDEQARTELYTEAMQAVHDAASWVIPAYASILHGASKSFNFEQLPPATAGPHFDTAWLQQ